MSNGYQPVDDNHADACAVLEWAKARERMRGEGA